MATTTAQYRHRLPQLSDHLFLSDGGLETTLIFHQGWELPEFAAFDLLKTPTGYRALETYFHTYARMARRYQTGLILESATWRANPDWGQRLGYAEQELAQVNREAIALLHKIRQQYETEQSPMVISGCLGPRGDGYVPGDAMTAAIAAEYHRPQIAVLRDAGVDLVSAITMNYVEEAIGITQAAQALEVPVVISFTVETDGHLPTGQSLPDAISQVDRTTNHGPAYYMINCAHPSHFVDTFKSDAAWLDRIRGLRANASTKSHAELNESDTLDDGNPTELGQHYRQIKAKLRNLNVLGGCCGTDDRHVEAICQACLPVFWAHLSPQTLIATV